MRSFTHSAVLKREIEAKLASSIPNALSPRPLQDPRRMQTGVQQVDALLDGGLPIGGVTEFTGMTSSGRTSLAFSLLAQATHDAACAYIDVHDTLDPQSAASAGVDLRNLLWIRIKAATTSPQVASGSAVKVQRPLPFVPSPVASINKPGNGQGTGRHPRTETRGLDVALGKMLDQKAEARLIKAEGTPGYPNRRLSLAAAPEEQIAYEHFNARRAHESDPIRHADRQAAAAARQHTQSTPLVRSSIRSTEKPWNRLDRAIRATDQVLQSGGFRVIVLDLATVAQEHALRIPSATWFRFRRAAEESDAIFLLLSQVACAKSSALCVLDCSMEAAISSRNLLSGLTRSAEVTRQRLSSPHMKKAPGRAVTWQAAPSWMRAVAR